MVTAVLQANLIQLFRCWSLCLFLTQSRVHFSFAFVDFMFSGATAEADASAHLLISVSLWTVCQPVTGLPAVKTELRRDT